MEELKNIIKEIQGYKKALSIVLSDDMILDCATRIFNSMNLNNKKESKEEKATDKQISLLKRLNYKGDISVLTKKEASVLIDEGIKEGDNGKRGTKYQ
jgi:hypothetical protein